MFTIIYHQDLIKKSYLTQKCQLWWYGTAVQLWEPTLACIDLAGTLETVTRDGFISDTSSTCVISTVQQKIHSMLTHIPLYFLVPRPRNLSILTFCWTNGLCEAVLV